MSSSDLVFQSSQVKLPSESSSSTSAGMTSTTSRLSTRRGKNGVVFCSAPAGNFFEDRTGSLCSCPDCKATSAGPDTHHGEGYHASHRSSKFKFEFVTSSSSEEHEVDFPLASFTISERRRCVSKVRMGGMAHLSGTFSGLSVDQMKPPSFRMEGESRGTRSLSPPSSSRRFSHKQQDVGRHRSSPNLHATPSKKESKEQGDSDVQGATEAAVTTRTATAQAPVRRHGGVLEQLFCGGFAGVVSRTAVAPMDLVKTHLISSHGMEGAGTTAMSVLKSIVKRDGWVGLFRGNGVNCLRVAPSKAIELCTFQMLKRILCTPGHPLQHIAAPLSGGAAGIAGTMATYPLEVMRTRISMQPEKYATLAATFATMVKEEGLGSMYRGLPISLVGVFPYAATNYYVYDALRSLYRRVTGKEKIPTEATLVFGALAASVSSAVTFPLEVARRRLQLGTVGSAAAPKSGLQVLQQICQKSGWRAVYRGLGTTWLKLIPAAGISFVCYEAARYALRVDDASCAAAETEEAAARSQAAGLLEGTGVDRPHGKGRKVQSQGTVPGMKNGRPPVQAPVASVVDVNGVEVGSINAVTSTRGQHREHQVAFLKQGKTQRLLMAIPSDGAVVAS